MARLAMFCAMAFSGCTQEGGPFDHAAAPPRAQAVIHPGDLASDVGQTPIRITVSPISGTLSTDARDELLAHISVVDSSGAGVATDVKLLSDHSTGPDSEVIDADLATVIEVAPRGGTWSDEWHALLVDSVPAAIDFASSLLTTEGQVRSRFRPDAHPTLQSVDFCVRSDDAPVIAQVRFSEVVDRDSASAGIQISFDGTACRFRDGQVMGVAVVEFECEVADPMASDVRFTMTEVRVPSGDEVTTFDGAATIDVTARFSQLAPNGSSCKYRHF